MGPTLRINRRCGDNVDRQLWREPPTWRSSTPNAVAVGRLGCGPRTWVRVARRLDQVRAAVGAPVVACDWLMLQYWSHRRLQQPCRLVANWGAGK